MHKWMLLAGSFFALTSVLLGAFAAHGLKGRLDQYAQSVFQTAAQYQMYHGLALIFCGLLVLQYKPLLADISGLKIAAICFTLGILFFSGSLYGLALTSQKWLGPITPIGGLFFILGWLSFSWAILKN